MRQMLVKQQQLHCKNLIQNLLLPKAYSLSNSYCQVHSQQQVTALHHSLPYITSHSVTRRHSHSQPYWEVKAWPARGQGWAPCPVATDMKADSWASSMLRARLLSLQCRGSSAQGCSTLGCSVLTRLLSTRLLSTRLLNCQSVQDQVAQSLQLQVPSQRAPALCLRFAAC